MKDKANKGYWQRLAKIYAPLMESDKKFYNAICGYIRDYLKSDMNVLELACGTGQLSFPLSDCTNSWTATDFSENMIKQAKRRGTTEKLSFCVADEKHEKTIPALLLALGLALSMTACGNKESETVTPDNSTTPEAVETQPTQEATGTEETTSRDDTGVYPNATGLTEVAMGVTEDICTFKVPLNYVLAGGYYDENNEEHTIQGLNSATTTVEEALAAGSFSTGNHMMIWANVTEQDLYKEKEIETSFGETLSWEYLCYVREHPVVWNIPTKILYGDKDNLTSYETMSDFASKMGISLTVMNNGEHWFHTDEQMNFLDDWICESNR